MPCSAVKEADRRTNFTHPSLPHLLNATVGLLRCFVTHTLLWDRLADPLETHRNALDKTVDIKALSKKKRL